MKKPFSLQRCPSWIAGTGEELGRYPTVRAGMKELKRESRGGEDRDLLLVDLRNDKVKGRSANLAAICRCEHPKTAHNQKGCLAGGCPCDGFREKARDDGSRILKPW